MSIGLNYDFTTDEEIFKYTSGYGSLKQGMSNALYGLSMNRCIPSYRESKDNQGYVFFTRPQLNMTTSNLRSMREFDSLLVNDEYDIHRYVRCLLDPRLRNTKKITSKLVNEDLPFIPVYTNAIKSLTGFQDRVIADFTSKPGLKGESWSMPDGYVDTYGVFDIDCTFYNFSGQPITLINDYWLQYMSYILEGMIGPYMDFIAANEMDYNTRIYRLIMDESMTFVRGMCATGASFPVSSPKGERYNFNSSEVYNSTTKDITIRFKSIGVTYDDSILVDEFNTVVGIFCPEVAELNSKRESSSLVYIDNMEMMNALNFRCIPWIDRDTMQLKWLIKKNSKSYQKVKAMFS